MGVEAASASAGAALTWSMGAALALTEMAGFPAKVASFAAGVGGLVAGVRGLAAGITDVYWFPIPGDMTLAAGVSAVIRTGVGLNADLGTSVDLAAVLRTGIGKQKEFQKEEK